MNHISATSRREFLRTATLATTGAWLATRTSLARGANDSLQVASIGVSGMGAADRSQIGSHPGVQIVALCDVDAKRLEAAGKQLPDATRFADWREMLAKMGDRIDAAHVSTPDHTHAPAAMSLMQQGKHVYCQKPLCHDVYEARQLRLVAADKGVVTQMGIQIHSASEYRTAVQLVRNGAIGKVKQVFSWSDKRWGYDGPAPVESPAPEWLNWDLWIGTAPLRPYSEGHYHPANWRKWLDFGCGTMGDMGIHILDPVFSALGIRTPKQVTSASDAPPAGSFAMRNRVDYVFPGTEYTTEELQLTWTDGGWRADSDGWPIPEGKPLPGQGSMFIGQQGYLLLPHIGQPQLLPVDKYRDFKVEPVPGANHWHLWVDACLGKGRTSADFSYSGPLTESLLLGVIANRFPKQTLAWDTGELRITNSNEAQAMVRRTYRAGFEVAGLS